MEGRGNARYARMVVSIGFVLVGVALASFALAMVWTFGEGLGATPFERTIYGGAHVSLHLFGSLCAFSIGMFLIDKSKAWAVLATFAVLLCGAYGIANMIGFASKNRMGVADAVTENNARLVRNYEANRMELIAQRNWYAGQSMSYDHTKWQRADFKKMEREYQQRIDALAPPKVDASTVNADGQATFLSKLTGTKAENWQLALAIPVAVLLFIGEVLSFIFAVRIWPAPPQKPNRAQAENDNEVETEEPSTSQQIKAKVVQFPSVSASLPPETKTPLPFGAKASAIDFKELIAQHGPFPSQDALASALGMAKGTVSKQLARTKGVQRTRVGKNNELRAVA